VNVKVFDVDAVRLARGGYKEADGGETGGVFAGRLVEECVAVPVAELEFERFGA
jgi:hypothetical protein